MGKPFGTTLDLPQVSTPSASPASGRQLLYVKSDGNLYTKSNLGVESQVGGGAPPSYTAQYARMSQTSPQTGIATSTQTAVTFSVANSAQPSALADLAGNRFIVQTTAFHEIMFQFRWAQNSTGDRKGVIQVNGSTVAGDGRTAIVNSNVIGATSNAHYSGVLNADDIVTFVVWQSSGGNLDASSAVGDVWASIATVVPATGVSLPMTLDTTQTVTGAKTFQSGKLIAADEILSTDYSSTQPTAPATGVTIFARHRARRLLAAVGPNGLDTSLQPALFTNRVAMVKAVNNVATVQVDGVAVTAVSAPTAVAVASTNFFTSMVRQRYSSTAVAGNAGGTRTATAQWFLSSTANMGGVFLVVRLGLNAISATNRIFIGMSATTTALSATVDPSTYLNMFGFACNSAHTTFRFMCNDASGTATMVDLGANFSSQTAATNFFEFRLFAPSGGGQNVYWFAERLNDGATASGQATTDLPAVATLLSAHVNHSNGTTAAAVSTDLQSIYIESDN